MGADGQAAPVRAVHAEVEGLRQHTAGRRVSVPRRRPDPDHRPIQLSRDGTKDRRRPRGQPGSDRRAVDGGARGRAILERPELQRVCRCRCIPDALARDQPRQSEQHGAAGSHGRPRPSLHELQAGARHLIQTAAFARLYTRRLTLNSSLWAKFLAAVLLFAMWLALVILKMVPAEPLVLAIGQALVGLGVYHASTSSSSTSNVVPGKLLRFDPDKQAPTTATFGEKLGAVGGYQPSSGLTSAPPVPNPSAPPAA